MDYLLYDSTVVSPILLAKHSLMQRVLRAQNITEIERVLWMSNIIRVVGWPIYNLSKDWDELMERKEHARQTS